jgi:hypothetical protein
VKATHPISGDEQVLDVELDRNTEFLPIAEENYSHNWVGDLLRGNHTSIASLKVAGQFIPGKLLIPISESHYSIHLFKSIAPIRTLKSLLPRVPMTMKGQFTFCFPSTFIHPKTDVKGLSPRLPYKLATTPAQFRNLIPGRRKAIEVFVTSK